MTCVFVQSGDCFAALACRLAVVVSDTFFYFFISSSHSLPHNGFSVMIVVFLQRFDARSSPADNGSACVLHYDEVAASVSSTAGMDGVFEKHLRTERNGVIRQGGQFFGCFF